MPLKVRGEYPWFCLEVYLEWSANLEMCSTEGNTAHGTSSNTALLPSAFVAMPSGDSTCRCKHLTPSVGLWGARAMHSCVIL